MLRTGSVEARINAPSEIGRNDIGVLCSVRIAALRLALSVTPAFVPLQRTGIAHLALIAGRPHESVKILTCHFHLSLS